MDKIECEVKRVEIARGVRLCKSSTEPFLIKVPRVKVSMLREYMMHRSDTYSFRWTTFKMTFIQTLR